MMAWKGPYWEPRDIWVGAYWTVGVVKRYHPEVRRWQDDRRMNLYLCLVPCFPIRIRWWLAEAPSLRSGAMSAGATSQEAAE